MNGGAWMTTVICDYTFDLVIASLAITAVSLVLLWFHKDRLSILCLAVSLLIQGIIAFQPSCASILDLRKTPTVGQPAR
jgi:hypothetical protein